MKSVDFSKRQLQQDLFVLDLDSQDLHIMPHFDTLKIYSSGKHCEKRRNCL